MCCGNCKLVHFSSICGRSKCCNVLSNPGHPLHPTVVTDQPDDHVRRITEFSIDAIAAANTTQIDMENPSLGFVDIRVGFHSGPVVA